MQTKPFPELTNNSGVLKSAAVYADPQAEAGILIREILKSLSWTQCFVSNDLDEIIAQVESFRANLIIIDDNPQHPVPLVLRKLLKSPICSITPTLAILNEQTKADSAAMATLCRPMLIYKPLSPGRFANGFKALTKVWSLGTFKVVTAIVELLRNQKRDEGMQVLSQLAKNPKAQPIVAPSLAGFLRRANNFKVAEKLLLASLRNAPRDLGIILSLTDLYLNSAMPQTAMRLLNGFENAQGRSIATAMDRIQASLMRSDLTTAIDVLMELHGRDILRDTTQFMMMKMLYSDGRIPELLKFVNSDAIAHKLADAWNKPGQPAPARQPLAG